MDWKTHKEKLLKNKEVVKALGETVLEYQVARAVIKARIKRGFTQQALAKKLNTTQSVISRLESGKTTPSLSLLKRLGDALGRKVHVQFV